MIQQPIGVMGCYPTLPQAFPLTMPENAGNMVHGNAPFEMFPEAVFYKDRRFGPGRRNFVDYVNAECSHLIVTVANFVKLNDEDGAKYTRFHSFLRKIDVPIVIFGLGAQAPTRELDGSLTAEAVDLMKFLGDRSVQVGVRGQFTADVFAHFADVKNTYVTGCPSFFSRPEAFAQLADAISDGREGRPAYNGTTYHDALESEILARAIQDDHHLVEPVNRFSVAYANALQRGDAEPPFPWFLKRLVKSGRVTMPQLERYFSSRFHLFRDTSSWYNFNVENVGYTYGTRFHANMASLISGVPALWVTHDSRTEELTETLHLPAVPKHHIAGRPTEEIRALIDYSPMFEALPSLFANFNAYLAAHGLPAVSVPDVDGSRQPAVVVAEQSLTS